jgi:ABC-type transport system involved in multi-copper enzyme maturation permease subunit
LLVFTPGRSTQAVTIWSAARFLMVSLGLSAGLAGIASAQLRAAATREPGQGGWVHLGLPRGWRLPGPSLDGNPVLWREWQIRRPRRWGLVFCLLYALMAICTTAAIMMLTGYTTRRLWVAAAFLNATQVSAGLLLLSISSATSLAEERVRGRLDVLLATPLSTRSIVWGKWWGTFRAVPLLALPPGVALAAVAWHHAYWSGLWLVVGIVVAYGAALTSLGLALATWVKRPGHAVALCAAAHVGITVGWVLVVAFLTPGAPGMRGPGLAAFSPFVGVMLPTVTMQFDNSSDWREVAGWLSVWIVVEVLLAAVLLLVVLATFDRSLGRAGGRERLAEDGMGL